MSKVALCVSDAICITSTARKTEASVLDILSLPKKYLTGATPSDNVSPSLLMISPDETFFCRLWSRFLNFCVRQGSKMLNSFPLKFLLFVLSVVNLTVGRTCNNHKVRDIIVKFVSIYVMNNLRFIKKSAKMFFHDKSMDWRIPSVSVNNYISVVRHRSSSVLSSWHRSLLLLWSNISDMVLYV
jgi:hypothetical protein